MCQSDIDAISNLLTNLCYAFITHRAGMYYPKFSGFHIFSDSEVCVLYGRTKPFATKW